MGLIAYELREAFAGTVVQGDEEVPAFSGGLVHVGTVGREANIAELVESREDGAIVVDDVDLELVTALDDYPALKRTTVPDGAVAVNVAAKYEDQTVPELRGEATSRGLEGVGGHNKAELITALEEHDRRLADGSLDELGAPLTVAALADAAAPETTDAGAAGGDETGAAGEEA